MSTPQERRALSVSPKNPNEGAAKQIIEKNDAKVLAETPAGHGPKGPTCRKMLEKISVILQGNTPYTAKGLGAIRAFWDELSHDARAKAILEMAGNDRKLANIRRRSAERLKFPL